MSRMRRLGGPVALYAVVASLAIAAPLSAQQSASPAPDTTAAVPSDPAATPAPTGTEAAPAPADSASPTGSTAPDSPAGSAEPASPAPAGTAPSPAAPAAADPAAAAAEPQTLVDEGGDKPSKKDKPVAIAAASTGVTISDFQFSPGSVTINVGDTVTWSNNGPTPHSSTSTGGVWDTGIMDAGQSGSHTFTEAGTFSYICTPHPNMKGTIVVQAAASQDTGGADTGTDGTTATESQDDGPSLPSTGMDLGGLVMLGLATLVLGAYLRRRTEPQPVRPAGRIGW
jgi:LPXTG-motif cell wall-anchored protein